MVGKKKIILPIVAICVLLVGFWGIINWQQSTQSRELGSPLTITDGAGRTVTITSYPDRIVSIAPSCTEILFAVGLKEKVVGAPTYTRYSSEIQERISSGDLSAVGDFSKINIEMVVGLDPDLILAKGGFQLSTAERLAELDKTVVVVTHQGFYGLLNDITLIGEITGYSEEADNFVEDTERRAHEIAELTQDSAKPRVYVEYFFNGGFASYGSESVVNELISMAGGVNVFAGFPGQYLETSTEEILKANPEIIIISKGVMSEVAGLTPTTIRERPSWDATKAVEKNQIYEIDENLITVAGPRLVDGLEELAKVFHPELFSGS